jgi:hypothetical protein
MLLQINLIDDKGKLILYFVANFIAEYDFETDNAWEQNTPPQNMPLCHKGYLADYFKK